MEISKKGKLLIYGGYTEYGGFTRRRRNLTTHEQFWLCDLFFTTINFEPIGNTPLSGGYSRILSLGEVNVVVFTSQEKQNILFINFNDTNWHFLNIEGESIEGRIGFGIACDSKILCLILGGYKL